MARFVDLYRSGKVHAFDIEDFVDRWHLSDSTEEIWDYLGITKYAYGQWVVDPDSIVPILERHFS